MALIIETIPQFFHEDYALAYFYCDYKDPATQEPINILGSLAKQIALRDISAFGVLEEYHRRVSSEGDINRSTSAESLRDIILNMTKHLSSTLLVVDGLDECTSNRSEIIELLSSLSKLSRNDVRTLFASRNEVDIRAGLSDYVEISIAAKSADIRLYVAAELQRRMDKQLLVLRNPLLKEHIMERLVEKADGM